MNRDLQIPLSGSVEKLVDSTHRDFSPKHFSKENRIANNRNTYAKRQREQEKRQRADDKRRKRENKIARPVGAEPPLELATDATSQLISENSSETYKPGLSG